MKKIYFSAVGICILLFSILFIPNTSHAEQGEIYEIGEIILNVRSEPSSSGKVIGQLVEGNKVEIFQKKHGWAQTYYAGEEAWIAAHYLIPVSGKSQQAKTDRSNEQVTITASNVNIRSGPGENHPVIASTDSGNTYNIVKTSGDWHNIELTNGNTGWVASWLTNNGTNNNAAGQSKKQTNSVKNTKKANGTLNGYTIVVDPGHGGKDPGAIGLGGIYEKDLISPTAEAVAGQLRSAGANVIMTRSGDYFVTLGKRVAISNSYDTDAFVSLHYNTFPMLSINGTSTYYYSDKDAGLATKVQSAMASTVPLASRGSLQANYKVLRENRAPSILMELGFITNPNDLAHIKTADYQNNVGQAITTGLQNYFSE
ncbi:N-acetylmuramoyl-L-alanine amidase [Virgibacillus halodenitrificans]|uniref:N-acetylmuramoyl-L-alanine amidase n=1 Tax=Virgibacillus halodenitrificans TaxID=1482 RepID=UPI00045CFB84|nr:N-acetylmuramoyl-L-alanine amidase [Virgibacillus halodenitrificans]CDQ31672.1 N-acetylmuramoyl-L-alanine amidase LytC precursor [Virgibacillus halodenitrificans]